MERKGQFEVPRINESSMEDDLGYDGMPIGLDRSELFAGGPYKADISAYSCRMRNELASNE